MCTHMCTQTMMAELWYSLVHWEQSSIWFLRGAFVKLANLEVCIFFNSQANLAVQMCIFLVGVQFYQIGWAVGFD